LDLVKSIDDLTTQQRRRLHELARRVREIDLNQELHLLVGVTADRIDRRLLKRIVDTFTEWMGRRFLFERAFLDRPMRDVRRALSVLFDESRDIAPRLRDIIHSECLSPLRVSTLSVLLQWHAPERYVPFNKRTHRTLSDFGLLIRGASNASPAAYARWLGQAEKYSQELDLPSPGHFDRLVWEYTKDLSL
jgi:hypothetical protein